MCRREDVNPLEAESLRRDKSVLDHLLFEHPTLLRKDDLYRELIDPDKDSFGERDEINNSIDRLRRKGLIAIEGNFVLATPAAQYCAALQH